MKNLLIWGAGGHGRVVLDVARSTGDFTALAFLDDKTQEYEVDGCPVVGGADDLVRLSKQYSHFIISIGDNAARESCWHRALAVDIQAATLVHPSASISSTASIGAGSLIMPGAVINAGAVVGANCIINSGAIVEHDCRIGDHVHLSPRAVLGGAVKIGCRTHLGIGASVLPEVSIGGDCTVGAGAVVLHDLPPRVTAVGVPARIRPSASETTSTHLSMSRDPRSRILLSVPHMSGNELAYVHHAFATNWLSTAGSNLIDFEAAFQSRVGLPCVALSSGTAAIHLGLRLLNVGPGDEVFCQSLTFAASANPIRYLGAEPVFIDSERRTWNLDAAVLRDALKDRAARNRLPKAVEVVHLFGQCAEMDDVLDVCAEFDVPVLEDAAEALGAVYRGKPAGTMGAVGAFSFNGNKIITTTGGGMLASRNPAWVEKARFWSQQSREPQLAYHHLELGHNYRMSNVLAGIGLGQLSALDLRVRQRRAIALRYREAFEDLPGIVPMPQSDQGLHTNWLSCFVIDAARFGCSRDELIFRLDLAGIESRPVWKPMHLQPFFAGCARYGGDVAEDLFHRGICLPSSSSLSLDDQAYVIDQVRQASGVNSLIALHAALVAASRDTTQKDPACPTHPVTTW